MWAQLAFIVVCVVYGRNIRVVTDKGITKVPWDALYSPEETYITYEEKKKRIRAIESDYFGGLTDVWTKSILDDLIPVRLDGPETRFTYSIEWDQGDKVMQLSADLFHGEKEQREVAEFYCSKFPGRLDCVSLLEGELEKEAARTMDLYFGKQQRKSPLPRYPLPECVISKSAVQLLQGDIEGLSAVVEVEDDEEAIGVGHKVLLSYFSFKSLEREQELAAVLNGVVEFLMEPYCFHVDLVLVGTVDEMVELETYLDFETQRQSCPTSGYASRVFPCLKWKKATCGVLHTKVVIGEESLEKEFALWARSRVMEFVSDHVVVSFFEDDHVVRPFHVTPHIFPEPTAPFLQGLLQYEHSVYHNQHHLIGAAPVFNSGWLIYRHPLNASQPILVSPNSHQAGFIAPTPIVQRCLSSPPSGHWFYPTIEMADSQLYVECGLTKFVPLPITQSSLIHHAPDKYAARHGHDLIGGTALTASLLNHLWSTQCMQ